MDLSSWKEKIERDAAGAGLLLDDSEEEEEDDRSMTVLVEHQTDVAMEGGGISQELYKDGILTVGCVGESTLKVTQQDGVFPGLLLRRSLGGIASQVPKKDMDYNRSRFAYKTKVTGVLLIGW